MGDRDRIKRNWQENDSKKPKLCDYKGLEGRKQLMRVVAMANQKGGCGKTTTSINLAACLAKKSRSVLLIDLDPQAHSTVGLNVEPESVEKNVYHALAGSDGARVPLADTVTEISENFGLAPSSVILSAAEQELAGVEGREYRLRDAIAGLNAAYDYVIIDCPPSLGLLTFNAIVAAAQIIIPIETSFFALHGTGKLLETVELVSERTGHRKLVRALIVMFDRRTRFDKEVRKDVHRHFGSNCFKTVIRHTTRVKEAASAGIPVIEYDPKCMGAADFTDLAKELIAREKTKEWKEFNLAIRRAMVAHPVEGGILFSFNAPEAESVFIVGDFNNWSTETAFEMKRNQDGIWTGVVPLPEGNHEYKFVVNDEWYNDPANANVVENGVGGLNSLITVE